MTQLRALNSGFSADGGSADSTSNPALEIVPEFSASAKSRSLTSLPRPVLITKALCFMRDNVSPRMSPSVSGVNGQ